jgi:hypothetical protein
MFEDIMDISIFWLSAFPSPLNLYFYSWKRRIVCALLVFSVHRKFSRFHCDHHQHTNLTTAGNYLAYNLLPNPPLRVSISSASWSPRAVFTELSMEAALGASPLTLKYSSTPVDEHTGTAESRTYYEPGRDSQRSLTRLALRLWSCPTIL